MAIRNIELEYIVCAQQSAEQKKMSTINTCFVRHCQYIPTAREIESIGPEQQVDQQTLKAISFAAGETQLSQVHK